MTENQKAKALRWVANQIPDFKPKSNEDKMLLAIKRYSTAGADEIARLTAENAELRATLSKMETVEQELRERLEKAVELPCKVGDTVYCIRNLGLGNYRIEEQTVSEIVFDYNNRTHAITSYGLFGYEKWTFNVDCVTDRAEAESRLAELKGG